MAMESRSFVESSTFRGGFEREQDLREAASAGLDNLERLIRIMASSHQQQQQQYYCSTSSNPNPSNAMDVDCSAIADVAVNKFKKVVSLLSRTGHARFRRGPSSPSPASSVSSTRLPPNIFVNQNTANANNAQNISPPFSIVEMKPTHNNPTVLCPVPISQIPHPSQQQPQPQCHPSFSMPSEFVAVQGYKTMSGSDFYSSQRKESSSCSPPMSTTNSFVSSVTGDGSVVSTDKRSNAHTNTSSNTHHNHPVMVTPLSSLPPPSSGRPPLSSSSMKKKCQGKAEDSSGKSCGSTGKCHCSKRRKNRMKRTIRVPAISLKMADIPQDEYSWRKYGQKPIKGSPHPRKLTLFNKLWMLVFLHVMNWRTDRLLATFAFNGAFNSFGLQHSYLGSSRCYLLGLSIHPYIYGSYTQPCKRTKDM